MGRHYSFRVTDPQLIDQLEIFKRTGNLSKLINELLWNYFFGKVDLDTFSREMVEVRRLKEGMIELKNKIKEYFGKIEELEAKFQKLVKEEIDEKEKELISKLREEFKDILEDTNTFLKTAQTIGRNPKDLIASRLHKLALENQVSVEEVKKLLPEAVPEIENLLN
jgi:uncharacterized protein with NRDE domain